jgi:hypothetical protein
MCGIVGYVGPRKVRPLLLAGLEKLEYRGYDSAGISIIAGDHVDAVRAVGNLNALRMAIDGRDALDADSASGPPGSATPAGRRMAALRRRTPTRTTTRPTASTSSSMASSRTTWG